LKKKDELVRVVSEDKINHAVYVGVCCIGGGMEKKTAEDFAREIRAALKPALPLQSYPTEQLTEELKARERCMDCRTNFSNGWHDAGENRTRCADCQKKKQRKG
jgi:hypothetical protein